MRLWKASGSSSDRKGNFRLRVGTIRHKGKYLSQQMVARHKPRTSNFHRRRSVFFWPKNTRVLLVVPPLHVYKNTFNLCKLLQISILQISFLPHSFTILFNNDKINNPNRYKGLSYNHKVLFRIVQLLYHEHVLSRFRA